MATSKVPLSVPVPQVIFSDAQYTIIPDVSSYKLHDKNTYVSSHSQTYSVGLKLITFF